MLTLAVCFVLLPSVSRGDEQQTTSVTETARERTELPETFSKPVSVKVLAAAQAADGPAMPLGVTMQTESEPTTPAARYPQYQMGHLNRTQPEAADIQNPRLRLLLTLPDALILLDAILTIDGEPYQQAREKRVQDLLKFAQDPEAWRAERVTLLEQLKALADQVTGDVLNKVRAEAVAEIPESESPESESADLNEGEAGEEGEATTAEVEQPKLPPYLAPASLHERIERYLAATEQPPSAEELRWLLTNWVDGPVLLFLNDHFQRYRSDQAPVFRVLDRDRDGIISESELEMSVTSFQECDLNRDDIVQYSELNDVARDPRLQVTNAGHGRLIYALPSQSTAASVWQHLRSRYAADPDSAENSSTSRQAAERLAKIDVNGNDRLDDEELSLLQTCDADLTFRISFSTQHPETSQLQMVSVSPSLMAAIGSVSGSGNDFSVSLNGTRVSFSAVQSEFSDQISVGAVDDGYPMLPVVDPNDDGRFTIRELRKLQRRLTAFDGNGDGRITPDEARSTIRICFGLGPLAHTELATIRQLGSGTSTAEPGPDWFVRMDRNRDNDLSRKEFPGNDEQFAELDLDSDELISAEEARRSDLQTEER
ncbi:MAG: EF-hand domain-containing protein [Planctomycetaceae bacterium]